MKRELADRPLACVIWDDAHGTSTGEYAIEDIAREVHQPSRITTFGLLMQDDAKGVTLASEITSDEAPVTYRGLSFIPRGMIRDVIPLGIPKRPGIKQPKINKEDA